MEMAKLFASLNLVLLLFFSVRSTVPKVEGSCYLTVVGGGCPDVGACRRTCIPSNDNDSPQRLTKVFCVPPQGGSGWICTCEFDGARDCPPI
ncbi:hypothetical protein LguiA_001519 [Lonicera macranthoides]